MLHNFFPLKTVCRKMWWSQRSRRWRYGGPLHAGLVRLHACKHTHTRTPMHTYTHSSPRARTHSHIHTRRNLLICAVEKKLKRLIIQFSPVFCYVILRRFRYFRRYLFTHAHVSNELYPQYMCWIWLDGPPHSVACIATRSGQDG